MFLKIFFTITLSVGLGLIVFSSSLPYYEDGIRSSAIEPRTRAAYYQHEMAFRTNKLPLTDLGWGTVVASTVILAYLIFTKTTSLADFKKHRTPSKKTLWRLANGVWMLLIPGDYLYYTLRGQRGDYPPFADSIAIPIFMGTCLYLVLLLPLNGFLYLTLRRSQLPTKIFIKATFYNREAILWEVFFSFWILVNLLLFVSFLSDGDHFSIVVNLFFTFLLLCLRAGKIKGLLLSDKRPDAL